MDVHVIHTICKNLLIHQRNAKSAVYYITYDSFIYNLTTQYPRESNEYLSLCHSLAIVPSLLSIPLIRLIYELNNKIDVFINSYIGCNSIVCIYDLDIQLTSFLNNLCIVSLFQYVDNSSAVASSTADPNEINLDDDMLTAGVMDTQNRSMVTLPKVFKDFGVGYLHMHPLIVHYFKLNSITASANAFVCTVEVMNQLNVYYEQIIQTSGESVTINTFDASSFVCYLCKTYRIERVADIGVIVKGSLHTELLAIQHVHKAQKQRLFDWQMNETNSYDHDSYKSKEDAAYDDTCNDGTYICTIDNAVVSIVIPTRDNIMNLIESIKTCIDSNDTTSASISSYAKMLKVVHSYIEAHVNKAEIRAQMIEVVTEYLMLLLGSDKHRKKRLKIVNRTNSSSSSSSSSNNGNPVISSCGSTYTTDLQQPIPPTRHNNIRAFFESKITVNNTSHIPHEVIPNNCLVSCMPSCSTFHGMIDTKAAGRWGEALVYQYLLTTCTSNCSVSWLNQVEESRACYDIIMTTPTTNAASNNDCNGDDRACKRRGQITSYIEVKSTRYSDNNVFELSLWEWEFATAVPIVPYHIYRVYNAGDTANAYIVVIKDILQYIKQGSVKLCLAI